MKRFLIRIVVISIIAMFVFIWYRQEQMMASVNEKIVKQEEIYEKTMNLNVQLSDIVDSANTDDFFINQARGRLGRYQLGEVPIRDKMSEK